MKRGTRISTQMSPATTGLLERHARATGVKKGYLVEHALLHHLHALDELPAHVIIPPRLVVSRRTGEETLKRLAAPPRPTKQLSGSPEGQWRLGHSGNRMTGPNSNLARRT